MPPFAQHTKLLAAPGKRDELVAKFLEAVEIQRDNPACEIMLVSTDPGESDNVYLTEVWSSRDAWNAPRRARRSRRGPRRCRVSSVKGRRRSRSSFGREGDSGSVLVVRMRRDASRARGL